MRGWLEGMSAGLNLDLGDADEPVMVRGDRSLPGLAVVLDPGAQALLDPRGGRGRDRSPEFMEIFVLLAWAGGEGGGAGQVAVRAGAGRVGLLAAPAGSAAFGVFLEEGARRGRAVVAEAFRDHAADGSWRLEVYRPGPGGRRAS